MEALSADEKQSANDLVASATEAIASVKATMDAAVAAHAMLVEQEADQKAKQAIEAKADNVATSPDGSQTQVKLSDVLTAVMLGEKTQMIMAEEGGGEQTVLQYSSAEGLTQGSQYMYVCGEEQAQRQGSIISVALKDGSQVMANSAAAEGTPKEAWTKAGGSVTVSFVPDGSVQVVARIGRFDVIQIAPDKSMYARTAEETPSESPAYKSPYNQMALQATQAVETLFSGLVIPPTPTPTEAEALVATMGEIRVEAATKLEEAKALVAEGEATITMATTTADAAMALLPDILAEFKKCAEEGGAAEGVVGVGEGKRTLAKVDVPEGGGQPVVTMVQSEAGQVQFPDGAALGAKKVWIAPAGGAPAEEGGAAAVTAAKPPMVLLDGAGGAQVQAKGCVVVKSADARAQTQVQAPTFLAQVPTAEVGGEGMVQPLEGKGAGCQVFVQPGGTDVDVLLKEGGQLSMREGVGLMAKVNGGEWVFKDGSVIVVQRAGEGGTSSPQKKIEGAIATDAAING